MLCFAARQERLLQGLMREIVRMTAQKQPLQVGVPLYPFSHASLFAGRTQPAGAVDEPAGGMPLPSSPPIEEAQLSPGTLSNGFSPALSVAHRSVSSGWPGSPLGTEEEITVQHAMGSYVRR